MAITMLVIGDAPETLQLLEELLRAGGYEVARGSFADARATIERSAPGLIVIDCRIGDETGGWELLQQLKLRRATAAIPAVICSANKPLLEQLEGRLTALGVGVVLKPFLGHELLLVVAWALQNQARAAERGGPS